MKTQPIPCPRPHQELIKAWADGAIIQFWDGAPHNVWRDVKHNQPTWAPDVKYRVKMTPRTQYLSMAASREGAHVTTYAVRATYEEAMRLQDNVAKFGANVPAGIIHVTSDPTTGKVLTAEVVK